MCLNSKDNTCIFNQHRSSLKRFFVRLSVLSVLPDLLANSTELKKSTTDRNTLFQSTDNTHGSIRHRAEENAILKKKLYSVNDSK